MVQRTAFILVAAFWVLMNVLLWRAEYGSQNAAGSEVPIEAVWKKVLGAADISALEVRHHGRRIGFCRWGVAVNEAPSAAGPATDENGPEGMVRNVTGYRIEFSGNLVFGELPNRWRFDLNAGFSTNQTWRDFNGRLTSRPGTWEIHATAADRMVWLNLADGTDQFERTFTFAELSDPQALLSEFADPVTGALLSAGGLPMNASGMQSLRNGLKYEARLDSMKIGRTPVRVYRCQARLLDRYQIVVFVSRAGEILRVELPDDLVLVNDQLGSY
jgi:hypothetical protein